MGAAGLGEEQGEVGGGHQGSFVTLGGGTQALVGDGVCNYTLFLS